MVVSETPLKKWDSRAESFARIRAQISQILAKSDLPLDVAEIASEFKLRFRYLPSIERRLRELCDSGAVKKLPGKIPRYKLA